MVTNGIFPNRIKDFLNTLLAPGNESLAARVDSLIVDCSHALSSGGFTPEQNVVMSRYGVELPAHTCIHHAPQDTLVVIILHLLPRLQVLDIGRLQTRLALNMLLLKHNPVIPTELPLALQSIREFRCERANSIGGITVKNLLMLLNLPLIRTVKVDIIEGWQPAENNIETPPTSNVTSLSLTYRAQRVWSLPPILRRIHAIERFTCSISNSIVRSYSARLGIVLQPRKDTLRYLRLDCATLTEYSVLSGGLFTIGSLRDWPVLHTVISSMLPLLGTGLRNHPPRLVNVLPGCLRQLQILEDQYWSGAEGLRSLLEVLKEKKSIVPQLEKVALCPIPGSMSITRSYLIVTCKAADVMLVDDTSEW